MYIRAIARTALIVLCGLQSLPAGTSGSPALPLTERVYLASRIYASLAYFAHWQNVPGMDIESAYQTYLSKVIANEDRTAFSRASMEFLAGFHNGHTIFIDRMLVQQGGSLPFIAQPLDGKWTIIESWIPGISPGDVIDTMDSRPFDEFLGASSHMISSSTESGSRRLLFARIPDLISFAHLFPEQFTVSLSSGRTVHVDRRALQPAAPLQTEGRWLEPGQLAYLRIPSIMGATFEKRAIELAAEFRKAPAMIVDVRNNAGGSSPTDLIAALMDRPYRWWSEAIPLVVPFFRFRASQGHEDYDLFNRSGIIWPPGYQQPPKEHFPGKLALLVDGGCVSSCEDFTMPFKDTHRAEIVGETTAGSSGQPYVLDLGHDMMILIGAKRESFPDGAQFEGIGIKPDVEIRPTIEDLRQGRDTVLEAARRRLATPVSAAAR
jgi:carboxyl-terminal processing protease